MAEFIRNGYRKEKIILLNQCRMFLGLVCVSDISDMQLTKVETWALEGRPLGKPYGNTAYGWPRSPTRLSAQHWTVWKEAIHRCFIGDQPPKLWEQGGKWHRHRLHTWRWKYHTTSNRLYYTHETTSQIFQATPGRNSRLASRRFQLAPFLETPPEDSKPCTVDVRQGGGLHYRYCRRRVTNPCNYRHYRVIFFSGIIVGLLYRQV